MPAGSTYSTIATTTLGSAQASISLSSIPSTYTDLLVVASIGSASPQQAYVIRFNSDSGSNYSWTRLSGIGTGLASSSRGSTQTYISGFEIGSSTDRGVQTFHLNNYSNTNVFKTGLFRTGYATYQTSAIVGLWQSTSAINSITITSSGGANIVTGSTLTLYGITAA
jgi:hypothetical protein